MAAEVESSFTTLRKRNKLKHAASSTLFYVDDGAGTAGIGIGDLFVDALLELGVRKSEARKRCWFVDSKGLVVSQRKELKYEK